MQAVGVFFAISSCCGSGFPAFVLSSFFSAFVFVRSGSGNTTVSSDDPPGCLANLNATSSALFDEGAMPSFGAGGFWLMCTFVMSVNE